jgi:hypothetical protein
MKKHSLTAASVLVCVLVALAGCSSGSSDGASDSSTTVAESTTVADGGTDTTAADSGDEGTTETSEAGSPDVTAPAATGDDAKSADAQCAAFGAYLEQEVDSGEVTLEADAQPGVPCNYTSPDFERAILEVFPRNATGNAQQKDFEVVCQDVAEGRGDAPESSYVTSRARHMTSKALTSTSTSDSSLESVDFLLGEVLNKAGNPSDLFAIACDDDNAYQARLRINSDDPDYYVNPELLINAATAGINA